MKEVIGFRCSTNEITYCRLSGSKEKPKIIDVQTLRLPKALKRIDELRWIYSEINDILEGLNVEIISMKDTEPIARNGNKYTYRLENETTIIIACALKGIKNYYKKVNATIAKDFGFKGKKKYLEKQLDKSVIKNYEDYNYIEQEAILVAWSILK